MEIVIWYFIMHVSMKCIILAAGKGTRMRPLTLHTPKPMVMVLGKPLLEHIINELPSEITELILVVGYQHEKIRAYFGDKFSDRKIVYVIQEEQLGTAHALNLARPYLNEGEKFLFMFADDLHSASAMKQLVQGDIGMLVQEHEDPRPFGVVEVDKEGRVTSLEEKPADPKSNMVAVGVFLFDDRIFNYPIRLSPRGEYEYVDQVVDMLKDHDFVVEKTNFWHPIGYPQDVEVAERKLREAHAAPEPDYTHIPAVIIAGGNGTRLPEGEQEQPKCLVEIAGKPMLAWQIEKLRRQGFKNIRLSLGYKAQMVVNWLQTSNNTDISYVIENEPLGTGGGLRLAAKDFTTPFIALNCDDIADVDFASLMRHGGKEYNVISGMPCTDATTFESLVHDKDKRVLEFRARSADIKDAIVNIGHYYLQPNIFADMPEKFSNERDLFPKLVQEGKLVLHTHKGYWLTANNAEQLAAARDFFSK